MPLCLASPLCEESPATPLPCHSASLSPPPGGRKCTRGHFYLPKLVVIYERAAGTRGHAGRRTAVNLAGWRAQAASHMEKLCDAGGGTDGCGERDGAWERESERMRVRRVARLSVYITRLKIDIHQ